MTSYYIGSDLNRTYYISHHGILGQKWGVRRYQNKDGSLTSAGRARTKSYSWIKDKLGYDERDRLREAQDNARWASLTAQRGLEAKQYAAGKAFKPIERSEDVSQQAAFWRGEQRKAFEAGYNRGEKLLAAEAKHRNNPTIENKNEVTYQTTLRDMEQFYFDEYVPEAIEVLSGMMSEMQKNKKQEIDEYLRASNRYASAVTAEQRSSENLRAANATYSRTVLGRIEAAKAKINKGISTIRRMLSGSRRK